MSVYDENKNYAKKYEWLRKKNELTKVKLDTASKDDILCFK